MATDHEAPRGAAWPWYDYQPGIPVPNHVTHLRIGVEQAVAAARNGTVLGLVELPENPGLLCHGHPNLQLVQIHVHTVEVIRYMSFGHCPKLEKVEFVATTGESSIEIATTTTSSPEVQSRFREIADGAFCFCPNLHSVIGLEHVSCSLERIGHCAFMNCKKLTTLDGSHLTNLQYLGVRAFGECISLTVVDLSNSELLETIKHHAFWKCKTLKMVHLPPNLKQIHEEAFQHCDALASIAIPALVEHMGRCTFRNFTSLARVTFRSTRHLRTLMNDQQFLGCTSLHTLTLEGGPPRIAGNLWPLLLEQFVQEDNGILARAGIPNKQRVAIAWNFFRSNIDNFYEEEKKPAYGLKRDFISSRENNG